MLDNIQNALIALLIGALIILLALGVRELVRNLRGKTGQPVLEAYLDAVLPWLNKGVYAGFFVALWALKEADTAIDGMDRAAVANALYAILPSTLYVGGIAIPIGKFKLVVTREIFEGWIKTLYDESHAFFLANEAYLKHLVFEDTPPDDGTRVQIG